MPTRGLKPHRWVSGPDPERHKRYLQWLQQRNQAQYRGEGWDFSFDDWLAIWGNKIELRGREKGSMTMVRIDYDQPWTKNNARIVDRLEHAQVQQSLSVKRRKQNGQNN